MKMFKLNYHKNNLKTFGFLWQLCGEKFRNTTSFFIFFLKKARPKKRKTININYLIIVLVVISIFRF